jgi:hypothetical protein
MDIREYMQRVCLCGQPRSEHAHFHVPQHTLAGELRIGSSFVVRSVTNPACTGFVDAIERELGSCPLENPHLEPLVREQLSDLERREGN